MKTCFKCKEKKDSACFRKSSRSKDGIEGTCKDCKSSAAKDRYWKNPEAARKKANNWNRNNVRQHRANTIRKYNLTVEEYEDLAKSQDYLCAVCLRPETSKHQSGKLKSLAVHHDHKTGQVIALLCCACNRGIGLLGDDPERLGRAFEMQSRFN